MVETKNAAQNKDNISGERKSRKQKKRTAEKKLRRQSSVQILCIVTRKQKSKEKFFGYHPCKPVQAKETIGIHSRR